MTAHVALWIFIVLMVLGGAMGFVKAKSKASLIASSIFGIVLAIFALDIAPFRHHRYVLAFLIFFFAKRFIKSRKMMPAGMMAILALLTLIATSTLPE